MFNSGRWQANLRIMDVEEIKSVPGVPYSHPFIERLIGSVRREYLDHTLFWSEKDLARKLDEYKVYFNQSRIHYSLDGRFPDQMKGKTKPKIVDPNKYQWKKYCHGLYSIPIAA
jgi:putative transposase